MTKFWPLFAFAAFGLCFVPACEDNPDGFYKKAPAGAGERWNNGESAPIYDPTARNGFNDNFNTSSKQELCSGPIKKDRWSKMVTTDIVPLRNIGGLDLAGGDSWSGLDFRDAEKVNCQSASLGGDETTLTASWGDANEVTVSYKLSNNTIESFQLNQGFRGQLKFKSRPTDIDDPNKPNPYGVHEYAIGVGTPVLRDGKIYELNWKKRCDPTTPDVLDCWEKQATEMFDAIMYTFAPDLPSTQKSCITAQTCLAKTFSTGDAVFGVRPLGIYLYVPTVLVPQPGPSTPSYLYGFYVKLMPFSASELFLKLDEEGPVATAVELGDREPKVTCKQRLGMHYGEFLDTCVNVLKDPAKNVNTKNKLLGGMSHDKEAYDFSIEGVNLDFISGKIGNDKTVGDDWMPESTDESYEFNMDIRASGKVRNEWNQANTLETWTGTGAIYREYARRVQADIHAKMAEFWGERAQNNGSCEAGWAKNDTGKCSFKGFEIGDPACLLPEGANPDTWKPTAGCTGFEAFVTPGSHEAAATEGVKKVSLGGNTRYLGRPRPTTLGFKTALKAGDPIALFCIDPSPNPNGKDTGEACTQPNECWSNHCSENKCEEVQDYYFQRCDAEFGGLRGSLLDGSWQRVLQFIGGDDIAKVAPELRDRKFYFKHWAHSVVKYLKAAGSSDAAHPEWAYPTDLADPQYMPGGTACDGEGKHFDYGCEPEPDHLLFDQVGTSGDRDKFEYIDRRFVTHDREPLKVEYEILINSSNQQEWKFHRKLVRAERSLYMVMSTDRTEPPAGPHDNVRITNLVGSPIIASMGFRGVSAEKDAYYCASTLINGEPDPDCARAGSVPPRDSKHGGAFMLDDYGQPLLKMYKGAFTGTPFAIGSTVMKLDKTLPYIKSALVSVPLFPDPYNPEAGASLAATEKSQILVDWRPETPANGIRIPVNAQRDRFIPSATLNFSGSSLDFDIDYKELPDGHVRIEAVQSDNYQGNLFLCQDPVTGDLLSVEQYESTDQILAWGDQHPGAFAACDIIIRPNVNGTPMLFAAKQAGILLNIGLGSGKGRITSVEFYDSSL